MNISMVGRHIELTDAIKDHIKASIETFNKFHLDIISVSAVASAEERKGKRGVSIEFTINIAGKNTVVIKQREDDLYAAIDIATDRTQKSLRRMHDRISDHKNESINEAKNEALKHTDLSIKSEELEDEIIPFGLELYKPIEVADALEELKESSDQFKIFIDLDGKTRVIFKVNERKFGLY
jgi:putative sigma-54 modulation protein